MTFRPHTPVRLRPGILPRCRYGDGRLVGAVRAECYGNPGWFYVDFPGVKAHPLRGDWLELVADARGELTESASARAAAGAGEAA